MPEPLDQPLPKGRARWMRWTNPARGSASRSDTSGRVAEAIARFSGTPTFLIWLTVFVAVWMIWNAYGPESLRFDKAELGFTALTLMLSLQEILAEERRGREEIVAEVTEVVEELSDEEREHDHP